MLNRGEQSDVKVSSLQNTVSDHADGELHNESRCEQAVLSTLLHLGQGWEDGEG